MGLSGAAVLGLFAQFPEGPLTLMHTRDELIIAGSSFGGALAACFGYRFVTEFPQWKSMTTVLTFGAPFVLNDTGFELVSRKVRCLFQCNLLLVIAGLILWGVRNVVPAGVFQLLV